MRQNSFEIVSRGVVMVSWTADELARIGQADELQIASLRSDGSLRPYVIIWVVRAGDELYVRAAHGLETGWYRRAKAAGAGRISAGGVDRDVSFTDPPAGVAAAVDAEYHVKYDRFGAAYVDPVTGPDVAELTIRLEPRS